MMELISKIKIGTGIEEWEGTVLLGWRLEKEGNMNTDGLRDNLRFCMIQ